MVIPRVRSEDKIFSDFYKDLIHRIETSLKQPRQQAFLLWVSDWLSSRIQYFDAEQEGWYIHLLIQAWWNGYPPGTLPNDEEELKQIARFNPVNSTAIANLLQNGSEDLAKLQEVMRYEQRWAKVREMFVPILGIESRLHNRKLTEVLMKSLRVLEERKRSGSKGGRQTAQNNKVNSTAIANKKQVSSKPIGNNEQMSGTAGSKNAVSQSQSTFKRANALVVEDPTTSVLEDLEDLKNSEEDLEDKEGKDPVATDVELTLFEGAPEKLTKAEVEEKRLAKESQELFDYWYDKVLLRMHKEQGTKQKRAITLTEPRLKKIKTRLKEFSFDELKIAIDGCAANDWYMGRNNETVKQIDIFHICESSQNVDRFIGYTEVNPNGNGTRRSFGDSTDNLKRQLQEQWEAEDAKGVDASEATAGDPADRPSSDDDDDLPPLLS